MLIIFFWRVPQKFIFVVCISRQISVTPDPTTPQVGPVYTPEYFKGGAFNKPFVTDFDTDSTDSGHKEMSTESLALQYQKSNTSYWQNVMNDELNFTPGAICQVVEDIPSPGIHSQVVLLITLTNTISLKAMDRSCVSWI